MNIFFVYAHIVDTNDRIYVIISAYIKLNLGLWRSSNYATLITDEKRDVALTHTMDTPTTIFNSCADIYRQTDPAWATLAHSIDYPI